MSVLEIGRVLVDPPEHLPVSHLSHSSLDLFARCPMAWKRRYVDKIQDPASGAMTAGGAAGYALAQHFARIIRGDEGMSEEELLSEYSDSMAYRQENEDIDWGTDSPGELKDHGAAALKHYYRYNAPDVHPFAVERAFTLAWEGAPFTFVGRLDLEETDGAVGDWKLSDKRWGQSKCDQQLQPSIYMAARVAEGWPAPEFRYHILVRRANATSEILPTPRDNSRVLELLTARVFSVARAMEWRWLHDVWDGTGPDAAWLCNKCGFRNECPWRRGG